MLRSQMPIFAVNEKWPHWTDIHVMKTLYWIESLFFIYLSLSHSHGNSKKELHLDCTSSLFTFIWLAGLWARHQLMLLQ